LIFKKLSEQYKFDSKTNTYCRSDYSGISYSDGDDIEEYMRDTLLKTTDLSTVSDELLQYQIDWPTTYHLSPTRANLLRPLHQAFLGKKVLELGCGCGAITHYLGETAQKVVGVEGSHRRAEIAALRCRDLSNVNIVVDKIQDIQFQPETFDIVTLIGVLEYARVFGGSGAEIDLLCQARKYLKPSGFLVLAIENQLGLKYFAGIAEEHVGIPWWGINDAYTADSVVTFSRNELEQLLRNASFDYLEQFLALPDYKLPETIISPLGSTISSGVFNRAELLPRGMRPFDERPLFSMRQAWNVVNRAGLQRDLADSLCFVAFCEKPATSIFPSEALAFHYDGTNRLKKFAKESVFCETVEGIVVQRRLLVSNEKPGESTDEEFLQIGDLQEEMYSKNETFYSRICALLVRNKWTERELVQCIAPWIYWLRENCDEKGTLPSCFVDATPFNVSIGEEGDIFYFDREWIKRKNNLKIENVAFRGLFHALFSVEYMSPPAFDDTSIGSLCERVLKQLDLKINAEIIKEFSNDENFLAKMVYGKSYIIEMIANAKLPLSPIKKLPDSIVPKLKKKSVFKEITKALKGVYCMLKYREL
jgi:2-polyprenyl-3-methyl-5-hydroxy-6-metoxy-1,4-benzoquinol methylase